MEEIDKEMKATPLLSISIPTWNRAKFLAISLESFLEQLKDIPTGIVELYVSDNCSDDNTKDVVNEYIAAGLPITYNRNDRNLGAAGNFIRCMEWASGKYILLLGDDDIFLPGALKYLLDIIRSGNYGLIHIHHFKDLSQEVKVYENVDDFYKQISYWFTFMSGSVFRKEVVGTIDSEKYKHTNLLQMPYYIASAQCGENNLLINKCLLQCGLDAKSNGGYNFYEVFIQNYLSIWRDFYNQNKISKDTFLHIKKDIYVNFVQKYNIELLSKGRGIKKKDKDVEGKRNGFMIDGAWKYLFSNYGSESYFYRSLTSIGYSFLRNRIGRMVKFIRK